MKPKPKPRKQSSRQSGRKPNPRTQLAVVDQAKPPVVITPPVVVLELTEAQEVFALEWLTNGFNATLAYRTAHPNATINTARVEGCRALTKPNIRAYLNTLLVEQFESRKVGAEEALAGIGDNARVDARLLFDRKTGKMLEPHEWPAEISRCIRSVKDGPYGMTVTLESGFQARRLILEMAGKVKGIGDGFDALAAAIRADKAAHAHIPPAEGEVDNP